MIKTLIFCTTLCLSVVSCGQIASAYDNIETHPLITEKASNNTNAILDSYVKNYLGYGAGIEAQFSSDGKSLSIRDWLKKGSKDEDTPMCRASNHFHNPLLPWAQSYMTDDTTSEAGIIRTYCSVEGWPYENRKSAVTWATGFLGPAPIGAKASYNSDPQHAPFTWDTARDDYYIALIAPSPVSREFYFAQMFSALGHVTHLLQDVAVPSHTRNDFQSHLKTSFIYGDAAMLWSIQPYENYVKIYPSLVNVADPAGYIPAFQDPSVTKYWDTDQYTGTNPSSDMSLGLSEYTNANFFSDSTILKEPADELHSFPYPAVTSTQAYDEVVDGNGKKRTYLRKIADGETVEHLAAGAWYYKLLPSALKDTGLYLDDKCHDDYARKLLPRAIGYSAGLLNYFFRGTIDIAVPNNGVYALIDATATGFDPVTAGFTTIKLKATNTTATGESMTNGTIELVVKYKVAHANPFQGGLVETDTDFTYRVIPEKNNVSALYSATPTDLTFDLSQNPIPLWATDVYLQLVFKGTIGNEVDAVGVGFKDISEPTPIDLFNNMDKICIYGSWYAAGSTEAIAQVDTDGNHIADTDEADVYAYNLSHVYMKFAPYSTTQIDVWASPTVYDVHLPSLTASAHARIAYILSDYQFDYSIYHRAIVKRDPSNPWRHTDTLDGWIRASVRRQLDYSEDIGECGGAPSCYVPHYPTSSDGYPADGALEYYTFRGVTVWWGGQLIIINWPYPDTSSCSYDLL